MARRLALSRGWPAFLSIAAVFIVLRLPGQPYGEIAWVAPSRS